ncbi:IMS domain-containing protein [Merismopedia glauca]|uniref:Molecular chaperone DnaJ n=1 Tax=Merismopedia glauca CCAP 1448/3 TaxID=1296344 RepID=A0A2T1C498_9CYAN|nr:IMS domain-containing protein [Merismopedia glauca]PSB02967.1 molecular chaperone DnaJ [Merismopedia glauca CCAP 1448/3]
MQICLDYYRILGLPIQTSADQIESAYSDHVQQLPQHDYSEAAIASRHDLLTEAYEVLSRPERRIRYDGLLLKTIRSSSIPENSEVELTEETESTTPAVEIYAPPTLEITPDKFLGALLLLYELGEYQQILQIAHPCLEKPRVSFNLEPDEFNLTQSQSRDLILVVALAYLEIGREQWQKREYELAAQTLTTGKDLLTKESLFNSLAQEIQTEIYKLRPYRILELLSLEEEKVSDRMQGLQMLKEMLDARGGINGTKNDRSGLRTEDFLRFIQQIRVYLTSVEQQALFELEARRPSEVASYLAVSALIARGFDQKQPPLIAKAKEMLLQLSQRRDVHLERAICSLLLRQIEEAGRAIELSSDEEAVNVIREKSENAPDLLPGLCDYTEEWFDKELFPYFRDLTGKRAVLKPYFLDEEVQEYLTQVSVDRDSASSWETMDEPEVINTSVQTIPQEEELNNNNHNHSSGNTYGTRISRGNTQDSPSRLPSERIVVTSRETETPITKAPGQRRREKRQRRGQSRQQSRQNGQPRRPRRLKPLLWCLLGLGILVGGISWARSRQASQITIGGLEPDQLLVRLDRAPILIPSGTGTSTPTPTTSVARTLSQDTAQKIIQSWLDTKAKARGKAHQIDQLSSILTQPALDDQKSRAEGDRQANSYWEYEHSFTIKSVQLNPKDQTQASIDANVKEKAQLYKAGKLNQSESRDDELLVRYNLIEQDNQWRIREIKVLN